MGGDCEWRLEVREWYYTLLCHRTQLVNVTSHLTFELKQTLFAQHSVMFLACCKSNTNNTLNLKSGLTKQWFLYIFKLSCFKFRYAYVKLESTKGNFFLFFAPQLKLVHLFYFLSNIFCDPEYYHFDSTVANKESDWPSVYDCLARWPEEAWESDPVLS